MKGYAGVNVPVGIKTPIIMCSCLHIYKVFLHYIIAQILKNVTKLYKQAINF